jgi:hypothetical protein
MAEHNFVFIGKNKEGKNTYAFYKMFRRFCDEDGVCNCSNEVCTNTWDNRYGKYIECVLQVKQHEHCYIFEKDTNLNYAIDCVEKISKHEHPDGIDITDEYGKDNFDPQTFNIQLMIEWF